MITLRKILILVALLLLPCLSQAAIIFTVTGTVTTAAAGWNLNDPVSFTWTMAGNSPDTQGGATDTIWYEELNTQPALFADVTGTGLTGTYTRPVQQLGSPWSFVQVNTEPAVLVSAGTDAEFIGLYAPNNSQVLQILGNVQTPAFGFLIINPAPSPDTYFADYLGTYSPVSTSTYPVANSVRTSGGTMVFSPTSFTIAETSPAVPESGTWAAAALLLGGAGLMRWRKRAKAC